MMAQISTAVFAAAVGLLVSSSELYAGEATAHITAFTGTWKLDVSSSSFHPGPPFRNFTLTFATDGARHLDLTDAGGHRLQAVLPWSDGKEVVVAGMESVTAVSTIQGSTVRDIWRRRGTVIEDVRGAVLHDGVTLRMVVDATDLEGRSHHNELLFNKEVGLLKPQRRLRPSGVLDCIPPLPQHQFRGIQAHLRSMVDTLTIVSETDK